MRLTIRRLCPAKVNLYLKVLGRREDGYHELISIMQPLTLADELLFSPQAGGFSLECRHPQAPAAEENLVWRAVQTFQRATGIAPAVQVTLNKRIPLAAGLGGGSSDAAGTLLGLNQLYGEPLSAAELHHLAGQLGADVPFFLQAGPAVARGIGTRLSPLWLPPYWYLLLNPGVPLSTRWVYENLVLESLPKADWEPAEDWDWQQPATWMSNDLETVTLSRFPELKELMAALVQAGALGSMMSGSGPTVFGVFTSPEVARQAARGLRSHFRGWGAVARGLTGPAEEAWEDQVWIV
jgi:4-diphosphocytidyl-2-C-methyl-D-erythritol kinase